MDYWGFFLSILSTVTSGVLLAAFFFFFREKIFPLPDISGQWHLESITDKTTYNPYRNMRLKYTLYLTRNGVSLSGTSEKIYEKTESKKEKKYTGKGRVRGRIEGYLEKNYFSKDKIHLHIVEDGRERQSTITYVLKLVSKDEFEGGFSSTAADSSGTATLKRVLF